MAEQGVFEARLRAALARYVADGPTDFDALEFARAVAAAEPRGRGRLGALRWPAIVVPRVAWLLLAAALLLGALGAGALLQAIRHDAIRPAPIPSSWQRIVLPVPAWSGTIGRLTDVTTSEDGYLAVGSGGSAGGLVWTSRDGLDWALVPTGDTFVGAEINAVVKTDAGYVAVGNRPFMGMSLAAAWRSVTGRVWREVTPSIVDHNQATIDDVAFAGGRYVAVGWELGASLTPRIWVSDDAEHWDPATGFTVEPSFMGAMVGVAAGGPGFVAVGPDPGVWVSADGDSWTRSDPRGYEPSALGAYDVTAGRDGRVVVGGRGARVQVSDDGDSWTTYTLPRSAGAGASHDAQVDEYVYGYSATGLAAARWGYAAIGEGTWSGHSVDQALLWASRDGTSWVLRGLGIEPTSSEPLDVLACGDELIISAGNGTWALPGGAGGSVADQ